MTTDLHIFMKKRFHPMNNFSLEPMKFFIDKMIFYLLVLDETFFSLNVVLQ